MNKKRNYITQAFYLTSIILVALLGLSFIPETVYNKLHLKPIDIISDIRVKSINVIDTAQLPEIKREPFIDSCATGLTCFEDFSEIGDGLERFLKALNNIDSLGRPVRIAFMGDSYIEGDIFSADFREKMQDTFGGTGVGYIGISSQTHGFRKTVKHSFDGWSRFSVVDSIRPDYSKISISGQYYVADTSAWASFAGVDLKHLDTMHRAKILYTLSGSPSNLKYRINNTSYQTEKLVASNRMQAFTIQDTITNITLSTYPHSGLIFHGISLDDTSGVIVDNYSLRGSPGTVTAYIPERNLKDIDSLLNYDLIILQYGLNSMTKTNTDYTTYKERMIKSVNHIKKCFPNADILLLSIGDRSMREKGEYITMPGIPAMVSYQRAICSETEIVFWNMFEGMGGNGSMVKMVDTIPALANKDYTHLTFAGGKFLGEKLFETLMYEKERYERRKAYEKKNPESKRKRKPIDNKHEDSIRNDTIQLKN